jgi:hypothetical protein
MARGRLAHPGYLVESRITMRLDPTDALEMFDVRFVRTMTHCVQIDTRRGFRAGREHAAGLEAPPALRLIHTHGGCRLVDH